MSMKWIGPALFVVCGLLAAMAVAADSGSASSQDFAYEMQVTGTSGEAAAYRVTLPLALYQKIVHSDLSDLRVFNGSGEQVPYAIERPATGTVANAATALPLFALPVDAVTPDALRVTIDSAKGAINVQAGGQSPASGRATAYLVDGRALEIPLAALRLEWPEDAPDFAGRVKVEASDTLSDWHAATEAAPVANLHANTGRLIEQRVEFAPIKAKFWRVSWVGAIAPFSLTSILAEPAKRSVEARRLDLSVPAVPAKDKPGEYEYALHAQLPVDRINLDLPDSNTVVEVELLSRYQATKPWRTVGQGGFYRLKNDGAELRNGPVTVPLNTDPYWRIRTDPKGGGLGRVAPGLVVEWVPHEVVFVARGGGPFYLAYGSAVTDTTAAVSLSLLPKNLLIVPASLSQPELLGGERHLLRPAAPYAWKAALLWIVLITGAGLLAWMAYRLSRDVRRA